jgi:hypothetical protein
MVNSHIMYPAYAFGKKYQVQEIFKQITLAYHSIRSWGCEIIKASFSFFNSTKTRNDRHVVSSQRFLYHEKKGSKNTTEFWQITWYSNYDLISFLLSLYPWEGSSVYVWHFLRYFTTKKESPQNEDQLFLDQQKSLASLSLLFWSEILKLRLVCLFETETLLTMNIWPASCSPKLKRPNISDLSAHSIINDFNNNEDIYIYERRRDRLDSRNPVSVRSMVIEDQRILINRCVSLNKDLSDDKSRHWMSLTLEINCPIEEIHEERHKRMVRWGLSNVSSTKRETHSWKGVSEGVVIFPSSSESWGNDDCRESGARRYYFPCEQFSLDLITGQQGIRIRIRILHRM